MARNFETKFLRARVSMNTIKDVMRDTNPETVDAMKDRSRPVSFQKWKLERLEKYNKELNECILRASQDIEARYDPKLGGIAAWNLEENVPVGTLGELRRRLQADRISTSLLMKQRNEMRRENFQKDLDRAKGKLIFKDDQQSVDESFEKLDDEIRSQRSSAALLKAKLISVRNRLNRISFAQHNVRETIQTIRREMSSIRGMTLLRPPVSGGSIIEEDDNDDISFSSSTSSSSRLRREGERVRSEIQSTLDRTLFLEYESQENSNSGRVSSPRSGEVRLTKSVRRAVSSTNRLYHEAQDQSLQTRRLKEHLVVVEQQLKSCRALREALVARFIYKPQDSNGEQALIDKIKQAISRLRHRKDF